jgi:transposase
VTLQLLWEEHRATHPDGYGYSSYVAPRFMLRGVRRARDTGLSPGPRGT